MTRLLASDHILATRPGDPTTILTSVNSPDAKDRAYIQAMVHYCAVAGIDPFIALTQWGVETATGTSVRWNQDYNAAGIGIPADSTVQPFKVMDGDEAARIHAQALYSAVTHKLHDRIPLPDASVEWFTEIWLPKVNHPNYPGVTVVDDLNTRYQANGDSHATWAWDANYVTTLISRCSTYYPDLQPQSSSTPVTPPAGGSPMSDTIVFGRVPHPDFVDNPIWKEEGNGQNNLGKRSVKGVVWHRMIGSLWGTNSYFAQPSTGALTDYGVGTVAQDDAANDGLIIRWNDPLGYQSGWASGPVNAPYGDGKAFLDKYAGPSGIGVNVVNRDQASIEISGIGYTTALSQKAKQAVAALTAYWADQYRIPWDLFPIAPQDGFSFVRWHQEYTIGTGKVCPGQVVMDATPEMIEMTRAILKLWQVVTPGAPPDPTPEPPPPAPSIYPPGMTKELATALYGSVSVSWAAKPFAFDPERSECRAWLARGKAQLTDGQRYDAATWPMLVKVTRRYKDKSVHAYQFSDGFVFEKQVR